ncbi:MBL fold metallo-hydrolase [Echinimonas agarilytica]|uniref:MBL fold metallo-hydrolase n=1 Tax=Echinimonas agarilytica TaxID=1215918 RepID=A0AA41W810_9GAMM|nr:MBL fold metallo-hydrolase [Echinimonas agarilytica]MCM2680076.1 MBL fold metallo-hydrolase [Echinimonas agarilytica]
MSKLRFLGVGAGQCQTLGCSSAVFEHAHTRLLIDCGHGSLQRYLERYTTLPQFIYITHLHYDHIADLQALFYQARFNSEPNNRPQLFIAAALVPKLVHMFDQESAALAEGNCNMWQWIQLIPVTQGFWLNQHYFKIYPTRHHAPNSCFSLHLPGVFFYSADTRPVPEIIHHALSGSETIFHDCRLCANPSHTGLDDLPREYVPEAIERLVLYHYLSEQEGRDMQAKGYQIATPNQLFDLSPLAIASTQTVTPINKITL